MIRYSFIVDVVALEAVPGKGGQYLWQRKWSCTRSAFEND